MQQKTRDPAVRRAKCVRSLVRRFELHVTAVAAGADASDRCVLTAESASENQSDSKQHFHTHKTSALLSQLFKAEPRGTFWSAGVHRTFSVSFPLSFLDFW